MVRSTGVLLLASAATLFAVSIAAAGDSPFRKAAQGRYEDNDACARHGPGFVYLRNLDTCVRLSGRVEYEYTIRR